jgi:predicted O-methyltransferase YrrM
MQLIKNPNPFGDFEELTTLRKQLRVNTELIAVTDFGAGSKKLNSTHRSIQQIVRHGIAPQKQAEFLYRLMNFLNPKTVVELGTSVGLTSLYLAKAAPKAMVYTLEGCENLTAFSSQLFKTHHVKNITSITGNFNDTLPKLLNSLTTVDVLYIDGNHAYEPTMRYFELALQKRNEQTVFIFDDITWSEGMQQAWREICSHPEVTLSLDFFFFGVIFFRKEHKHKEHFILKF